MEAVQLQLLVQEILIFVAYPFLLLKLHHCFPHLSHLITFVEFIGVKHKIHHFSETYHYLLGDPFWKDFLLMDCSYFEAKYACSYCLSASRDFVFKLHTLTFHFLPAFQYSLLSHFFVANNSMLSISSFPISLLY